MKAFRFKETANQASSIRSSQARVPRIVEGSNHENLATRAADLMARCLAESGVELVFGLPGGAIAPLYDALLDVREIRAITAKHESNALFAAAGYAYVTGEVGVVAVTSGPGVLNCVTGLASARRDGLPIVLLVGEVTRASEGVGALQDGSAHELDIVGKLRGECKLAMQVPSADAAVPALVHAMEQALSGRPGPCVLTLPLDVLRASAREVDIVLAQARPHLPISRLHQVARVVEDSRSGVILAGFGMRAGDGPAALADLAGRLGWPVMTTPKAKGVFPENHPASLGVFGMGGHRSAREFLRAGVDTLLVLGSSLGEIASDGWSPLLQPRETLIHIDIDISRIGRRYPVDVAIEAPAALAARALCEAISGICAVADPLPRGVTRYPDPALDAPPSERISPVRAVRELQAVCPEQTVFAVDSGEHTFFAIHYLTIERPDAFIAMLGLGSMGASISGLGAKLGRPDRPVAMICGDGGFAMFATELATAAELGVELVVFVFNNGCLGLVERGNQRIYQRTPRYPLPYLDVVGLARAVGADAAVVQRPGELAELAPYQRLRGRPLVVDVRIDPDVAMPNNGRFESLGTRGDGR